MFWLSKSQERKNSAQSKNWPSMSRNASFVNGQTDRLTLPYCCNVVNNTKKPVRFGGLLELLGQK
jgi:hypothetical protein